TGRFINADGIIGANKDLLGYNLFAYCSNNPINASDPSGQKILYDDLGRAYTKGGIIDYNGTDGKVFRDVTLEIYFVLKQDAMLTKNLSTDSDSLFNLLFVHLLFHELVKDKAAWDIKREESWEKTIGTSFPGNGTTVYYNGYYMTPEQLGNYTYGYLGAAFGFPYIELVGGSFYAAGFPTQVNELTNEVIDWCFINLGYNDFNGAIFSTSSIGVGGGFSGGGGGGIDND
ncbi:MAG TPA: hypothetical protein DDZ99_10020, partial [Clostridiales bacterium]|nr:hypothetical protein [Clostridiales bacterium]